MKNNLLVAMIPIILFSFNAQAQRKVKELDEQKQDEQKSEERNYGKDDSWKDNLFFGGNFGGSISNGYSRILLQPNIGYKLSENFAVGISPLYMYVSNTYFNYNNKPIIVSDNIYGPGLFARFNVLENLFIYGEYLGLSYSRFYEKNNGDIGSVRSWSDNLFLGGGYSQGNAYIMFLYNVMYDKNSAYNFYSDPFDIRVGFYFGK